MAHWIIDDRGFGGMFYTCSNCGEVFSDISKDNPGMWDKCKDCGANLDEEDVYTDDDTEYHEGKANKAIREDIEKAMREDGYGVNGTVKPYKLSMFKLIRLLLTQQAILNDHKITELRRKESISSEVKNGE